MTVEAQRPTGRPDTAPRGPAGPGPERTHPKPSAPKPDTQRPPAPSPSTVLRAIDDALVGALAVAATALPPTDDRVAICGQEILKFRLRMARKAVADLLSYSGRDGKDTVRRIAAVASRPDQLPAGRPPLPGGAPGPIGFYLPRDVRLADAIGTALARRAD